MRKYVKKDRQSIIKLFRKDLLLLDVSGKFVGGEGTMVCQTDEIDERGLN